MGTEKKRGGCLSLLLKGILAYFILGAIVSFVVSSCINREYEQALSETTALMDAGDYAGAIARLDVYWEDYNKSDNLELTDLYIQCLKMEGKYSEAANIILSIFQEQGYEGAKDGVLHTRLSEILPNLSQEEQDTIQQALDALPDSLEEKERLEEETKIAEKERLAEEERLVEEAAPKVVEQAEPEPSQEEVIASNLYKTMYPVTLLFEYEENLIFRKGVVLDILVDGEKIAELKQGESSCYALVLSEGEHKLKISSSFINSDTIEFTVGEDPYLGPVDNYVIANLAFKNGDATISEFYTNRDAVSAEDAANTWLIILEKSTKAVFLNDYESIMELYYEKYDNQ